MKSLAQCLADPPRILTQLPQQLTWSEGDVRELTCNSDGKPRPRVTWKKGNRILKQGRQKAKLAFSPVTYRDEGKYTCIAENAGGRKLKEVQVNVLCKHVVSVVFRSGFSCTIHANSPGYGTNLPVSRMGD